ncbi:ectoine/hydroxyectoine ABC transporter substrate-binding protein EhuB [Bradyrhizobium japonicum]|uniref:ectoine/hydroxyectoine ABC transporter substrate-binding protein EhuB n=1 Tax=Bradyrhizobium japonicum TaxID=375 RepID=UPI0004B263AE|nr:ectoine/hydroxyectoine ABC transporter substrate-binding protein EhuB [Bradyrhizobium japonicum]
MFNIRASSHPLAFAFLRNASAATALLVASFSNVFAQQLNTNEPVSIAIANEPPFTELKPDGTLTGSGPDVDIAILKEVGFTQFKGEVMKYGAMIPALQASRVKMVSSGGLAIRPERCEQVIFSEPVTCGSTGLLARPEMAGKFDSYAKAGELGVRIGVIAGGLQEKDALARGVKRENAVVFPDQASAIKMLADGRIDAIALADYSLEKMKQLSGNPSLQIIVPLKDVEVFCAAAAFRKEDTALRDAYNSGLKKLRESGEFDKILISYGMGPRSPLIKNAPPTSAICGK